MVESNTDFDKQNSIGLSALQVMSLPPCDGVIVNLYQSTGQKAQRQTIVDEDRQLRFSYMLKGSAQADIQGHCITPVSGCGRIGYAPYRPMSFIHSTDFVQLEVAVDIALFQQLAGDQFEKVSEDIKKGLVARQSYCCTLKVSADMLARRLQSGDSSLLLYAASLEFIGNHLDGLDGSGEAGANLSSYERRCLHLARDYLLADLSKSPTIPKLANAVGLNQLKLKNGFKALFGDSIYACFQKHRMAKARLLLQTCSVTETALELGYSNLSHFSSAFKKVSGELPGQVRRQFRYTELDN